MKLKNFFIWGFTTNKEFREKVINALVVASFFSLTLFFFGPCYLYFTNALEYVFLFSEICPYFIVISLFFILLITVLLVPLRFSIYQRAISLLAVLSILLWLQGNILVWNYGFLDGKEINWSKHFVKGLIDGGIWLFFIIIAFIRPAFIYKIIRKISIVFILIQTISTAAVFIAMQPKESASFKNYNIDQSSKFTFSSKKNVIILLLDAFQTDIFQEIINEDNYYKDIFKGFTYFRNALGGFASTYPAIPLILTGQYYDNSIPLQDFIKNAFSSSSSLPKVLKENGFEVNLFPWLPRSVYFNEDIASNFLRRKTSLIRTKREISYIYDIILFRYTPHFLKKYIYNHQQWFLRQIASTDPGTRVFNILNTIVKEINYDRFPEEIATGQDQLKSKPVKANVSLQPARIISDRKDKKIKLNQEINNYNNDNENIDFIRAMIFQSTIGTDKYKFIFYHLSAMHLPLRLNEQTDYENLPADRQGYKKQAKGMLKLTEIFLNTLKKLGVYDNSLIFVMGDHGLLSSSGINNPEDSNTRSNKLGYKIPVYIIARALPLILVKPFNSKEEMKISDAPVSLSDIPKTIISELGLRGDFPGLSMFEVRESDIRERKFLIYSGERAFLTKDYLPMMTEYAVSGFSWLDESWRLTGRRFNPPTTGIYPHSLNIIGFIKAMKDYGIVRQKNAGAFMK